VLLFWLARNKVKLKIQPARPLGRGILVALILSIDLAYKSYADFGFCLLEESAGKILNIQYTSYQSLGLLGTPEKEIFAQTVLNYCLATGVSILMLDGPQGWKDPNNGLLHQRVCEKHLNTQAKTGTEGNVKPANFKPFVSFAIDIFSVLNRSGLVSLVTETKIAMPAKGILLVETYPYSAWHKLNIQPPPSKRKSTLERIIRCAQEVKIRFQLPKTKIPTHDELSALVAGLAGVAIAEGNESGYTASGVPPNLTSQGHLVEGYIANPR
jgi:hypothetical protein